MITIGIDLGTTYSLAAYWSEYGPELIPNALGMKKTPSVVSLDENGEILVGQIARERMITHPHLTAASFKRFMGTQKVYKLGDHSFSPEDLSALVLLSLKNDAESHLGCAVNSAVISVPAYFNDHQRKATKKAAEMAGLKVERLISEPTAAAVAYGIHKKSDETTFMVFDLGGGTFDVSILEMFEGVIEVKTVAGDNYLGGEDFTTVLIEAFCHENGVDIKNLDSDTYGMLYKQAETCKRDLTQNPLGSISLIKDNKEIKSQYSRDVYEKLSETLLLRLRRPVERALREASLTPTDLDEIVLIGGATYMPMIRSVVGRMFRSFPQSHVNPDEAVALGTAIQVALKQQNTNLQELILTDVCPFTLGVEVSKMLSEDKYQDGHYLPIIERNTPIPVSRVERVSTISNKQKRLLVSVFQGENRMVRENIKLGQLDLKVQPAIAGEESVDIRFTYDVNGILEVETTIVNTGLKNRILFNNGVATSATEEVESRIRQLESLKIHPRDKQESKLLIARGERLYAESLGERRDYISQLLQEFDRILETQDERQVQRLSAEIKNRFEELEGWFEFE